MLGLSEAGHAEYGAAPEIALITPAACEVPLPGDGPRLHGKQKVRLAPGSLARRLYEKDEVAEEFHCRNELNAAFQPLFEQSTLKVSGVGDRGEARVVELDSGEFFVGTLFLPQIVAAEEAHPLVDGFVRAVVAAA